MKKLKVLFVAEGATLAHVARPLMLAKGVDARQFNVTLCRPAAFSKLTTGLPFPVLNLECQDAPTFARKLEHGAPLYDFPTLCRYVDADLALFDQEKPDVVVGDFRLSLSVSARLRSIPYIAICDAYWSPERPLSTPLPVFRFTRYAPIPLTEFLFRRIAPLAFRLHALPLERLRSKFNLPSLGYDLRRCYTDADLRLFANFPALFPDVSVHEGADFIGPIAWSPDFNGKTDFLSGNGPLTYVTMGSSGNPQVIEDIVPILESLGSRIVIATAGKPLFLKENKPSTQIFNYLPGSVVCRHANLVICNGGSPTTNQALTNGVPVLGIAQNMDQFLNMEAIVRFGAGLMLRADRSPLPHLRSAIQSLLFDSAYKSRGEILACTSAPRGPSTILSHHLIALSKGDKTHRPPEIFAPTRSEKAN
ncbi:MAG: nucleotide disphospho-sugar-binding domain-containing protein [Ferribacterium limneticum]